MMRHELVFSTPGPDQVQTSDHQVLREVSNWVSQEYRSQSQRKVRCVAPGRGDKMKKLHDATVQICTFAWRSCRAEASASVNRLYSVV